MGESLVTVFSQLVPWAQWQSNLFCKWFLTLLLGTFPRANKTLALVYSIQFEFLGNGAWSKFCGHMSGKARRPSLYCIKLYMFLSNSSNLSWKSYIFFLENCYLWTDQFITSVSNLHFLQRTLVGLWALMYSLQMIISSNLFLPPNQLQVTTHDWKLVNLGNS